MTGKFSKINFILPLLFVFYFLILGVDVIFAGGATGSWDVENSNSANQSTQIKEFAYPWSPKEGEKQSLASLVSKFYNIALTVVGVAALGAIVYGGILYTVSAGSTSAQAEAREWIKGAVLGLALLLGAVLLLNTIGITKEGRITEPEIASVEIAPEEPSEESPEEPLSSEKLSEAQVTAQFDRALIRYKTTKTDYEGMRQRTVDEVVALSFDAQNKGIGTFYVYVTGGTEKGVHAENSEYTHANGYKFDIEANEKITKMIEDTYTPLKKGDPGCFTNTCYRSPRGAIYNLEPNKSGSGFHWDVLVK